MQQWQWYKIIKADLTYETLLKIFQSFQEYRQLISSSREMLKKQLFIPDYEIDKIFRSYELEVDQHREEHEQKKVELLFLNSPSYPELLKEISKPPILLYAQGRVEFSTKSISVVGSRQMTALGEAATEKLVSELVREKVSIVSGLSKGVDTLAHESCLKYGGTTVAVLASGLDRVFPKENQRLYDEIIETGCAISEFPLEMEATRDYFPMRNRVTIGLSRGLLITECFKQDEVSIMAQLALDENRDIYALPGFISHPSYEGCNELIQENIAKLVTKGETILEDYQWKKIAKPSIEPILGYTSTEQLILRILKTPSTIDMVAKQCALKTKEIIKIIFELELNGVIKSLPGGKYRVMER